MNKVTPLLLKIYNGLPDLTVSVMPERSWVEGDNRPGVLQDSLLITITVQNRLSFLPGPTIVDDPNALPAFGSDAKGVMVSIGLSSGLRQIGGIIVPAGFQAAVAPNNQTIFCFGGNIPTGASIDFVIEVIGDCIGGGTQTILAEVDPYSIIPEASKTNNKGSATISVLCIN